ncbi:MAG: peptidoglycan-binding protein LysM [Bacteroidota bacterium]
MGLFSFLKDVGEKVFNKDTQKPANKPTPTPATPASVDLEKQKVQLLSNVVRALNTSVEDLSISLSGDTVFVSGEVTSQADREKIILALGNVSGIASVDDAIRVNAPEPEPEATFHEVQKGDTLSKIAKKYYGDPMKYPMIFKANQPMLKSVDLIYPGQVLRIPQG